MKKLIATTLFLLLFFGCQARQVVDLNQMTTENWRKDIDYLNKKIQKEFNSFLPGLKETFAQEVETLKGKLDELENYQVAGEIMRLLSTLKDGHTELNIGHRAVGFHRVPLSLYFFENELHVVAAHELHKDLLGSKVLRIGRTGLQDAFAKAKTVMSRDNDMEYFHAGPGYMVLTEFLDYLKLTSDPLKSAFSFALENGEIIERNFEGLDYQTYNDGPWVDFRGQNNLDTPLYLTQRAASYWHTYLSDSKTMYFNLSRTNNQKGKASIKKFTKALFSEIDQMKPDKLVIDLRLNNGGNYNLTRPIVEAIKSRDWLNKKGKVWAITSRRTFSAASTLCIFLKQETNAQIIGEPGRTHPNWADNNEYMTLPNSKFLIEYTTRIKVHWPEEPNLDRVPVDISIDPTFGAYKEGVDAVLEYILKN